MPSNELQTTVKRWTQIGSAFKAAGKPDGLWRPLAQQDLQNVMQGKTAMPQADIIDALSTAIKGQPNVEHKNDQGSLNPLDLVGNALSDIGNIAWNFVPGVVHYAATLPQQIQDFAKLAERDPATQQKYGMETSASNPGEFLGALIRDASKVPVFGPLIPGLHTAANLTSEKGRQEIVAHPGFTALDLLPAAAKAGELAMAGREVAPLSVSEALQSGNPTKAIARATYDTASRFHLAPERAIAAKFFDNLGLSKRIVETVNRPLSILNRRGTANMQDFIKTDWIKELGKLPEDRQIALTNLAAHWNPQTLDEYYALPANERAMIDSGRDLVNQHAASSEATGDTVMVRGGDGKMHVYSADSEVAQQFLKARNTVEFLGKKYNEMKSAERKVQDRLDKLESKQGKVRKFGETQAAFDARTPGPVGLNTVGESMAPLIDSFAELDPRQAYPALLNNPMTAQARTAILKDVHLLEGHDGAFAQLKDAINAGDVKQVRTITRQIHSIFRHPSWDHTPYAQSFRDYMTHVRSEVTGIADRARGHDYAQKLHAASIKNLAKEKAKYNAILQKSTNRMGDYLDTLAKTPPAAFHTLIEEQLRTSARNSFATMTAAKGAIDAQQVQAAFKTIAETTRMDELKTLLGPDEFKAVYESSMRMWTDLANRGYEPMWLHSTSSTQLDYLLHPKVLDQYYKPSQFKDYVFNLGRSMNSMYASLVGAESELVRASITKEYVDVHLMPHVKTVDEVMPRYEEAARLQGSNIVGHTPGGQARDLMMKDWATFDPARYGLSPWIKATRDQELLVPKGVERSLSIIENNTGAGLPFVGERSRAMRVYKYAVLTGPRHMAHVMLGGMVFGAVRDPGFMRFLGSAHRMVQEGTVPEELVQSLHNVTDDGLWHVASAKTFGRLAAEAAGTPGRFMSRLEEHISNTYRTATMLSSEAKGMSREAALSEALKTYVDMDNMTAIERQVAKTVFPFYGFTKHILRYAFTLPVDHPIRVAMLARLASIEQKDAGDSLPGTFNMLFSLGSPDVNGNVTMIDYKSSNPFRSMYNTFTLAGVLSSLNPYMATAMQAAGLNVLTATPELYPELQIDPQTGQLVARHSAAQLGYTGIEAFVPEFSAVDHFVTLTDRMKSLKANNPEAYHRALWSSLNMPFAMTEYNLPHEMQKLEIKRFKQAQTDVSQAMKSNDFSYLRGYNQVPVPTILKPYMNNVEYASPEQVSRVWAFLNAQTPGDLSPKAVLPRARTRTSRR